MDSFLRYSSMLFYISSQIIPFSFGTYQIFRNPCRRDTLFKLENRHSKLSSDKLLSLVVPALAHCARGCLRDSNCLSLNYQPFVSSQVNCELLAGNKTTTGAVIQSSTGWIHYSPVIQEVTPGCKNSANRNPCNPGYFCQDTCELNNIRHRCLDIDECSSNPCQNGATCNNLVNEYTCTCIAGYKGINCETDIDECASGPCQNGATCNDLINKYTCTCAGGYTGVKCEGDVNGCASNPCQNGATCNNLVNSYTCTCVAGYTGTNCQTDVDECSSNPCLNGGTCIDEVNSWRCTCPTGYRESNCNMGPGHGAYCTSTYPCPEGEGDCDSDSACQGELYCGTNNCHSNYPSSHDCCQKKTPGHNEYCTSSYLCAEGEGDCDIDSECQAGLKCGTDNCQGAGYSSSDDCCERVSSCKEAYAAGHASNGVYTLSINNAQVSVKLEGH